MDALNIKGIESCIFEESTLTIDSNQKGELFLTSFNFDNEKGVIKIKENCNVSILLIGELQTKELILEIDNNSSVYFNVFSINEAKDNKVNVTLNEGSFLRMAYADFSTGTKGLNCKIDLNGRHSEVRWHLACLSRDSDKKTFNINFNHNVGETIAKMENYGVCKNKSTLKFIGDAVILKGAKKSSTKQEAKIMVFDKTCHASASPKLCIYENDVEASHGASEGQINPEHVFYLTSRGIEEENAKRLITLGYLYPILQYFDDEKLIEEIKNTIIEKV